MEIHCAETKLFLSNDQDIPTKILAYTQPKKAMQQRKSNEKCKVDNFIDMFEVTDSSRVWKFSRFILWVLGIYFK
jgi:hypothetical protein